MTRKERIEIIKQIEQENKSRLISYITSDRQVYNARIAEDAVRILYHHLQKLESPLDQTNRIDLFLYSRGGDVSVPWRIISMMREFCEEFTVLIPYKAYSAATMISLGADKIVMGKKAELGPIDPTLIRAGASETTVPPQEISVEDVSSYISFIKERVNISDQVALAQVVSMLAQNLTPLVLGSVNRQHSHIRLVARKLLSARKEKIDEDKISTIIEALTEKMYSHGHAIGRREAHELGLPIEKPTNDLENLMWTIFEEYEKVLNLSFPYDPEQVLTSQNKEEQVENDIPIAIIESLNRFDVFEINSIFKRRRQVPQNPQININLNLGLPPGIDPSRIPENLQEIMQKLMAQISQIVPQVVHQEIVRQSPIIGIEGRMFGGMWKDKTNINN